MSQAIHLTNEPRANHLTNRCIEVIPDSRTFTLQAWRGEVKLNLRYHGEHTLKLHRLRNGFEFDLILYHKPSSNQFVYELDTDNLTFHKQPALTAEEIAAGHKRPQKVVGSYAVYHSYKCHNISIGRRQENYKCGKFGHIFKPKAFDAKNAWTWCEMDMKDGYLILTVPEEFLDRADYPVRIDPVIGYNVAGASSQVANRVKTYNNMANPYLELMNQWGGTVTAAQTYCCLQDEGAGNTDSLMCVWQNVDDPLKGDSTRHLLSSVKAITSETPQWVSYTMTGSLSPDERYGVGWTANKYFSSEVDIYYDSTAPIANYGQAAGQSCTSGAVTCIPATLGTTGAAIWHHSIYALYTAGAAGGKLQLVTGWKIGNIEIRDDSFTAELRSRSQHLQQNIVELYTPECKADLGDTRCGIDLNDSAGTYEHEGAVTSVTEDRYKFIDTSVPSYAAGDVFTGGKITWSTPESADTYTGANAGFSMEIKKHDPSTDEFELFQPMPYDIEVDDEFTVTWGCDKTVSTCKDTFNNFVNFRGEPHVPGLDKLQISKKYLGRRGRGRL